MGECPYMVNTVPRASPQACKHAFTLIKTEKRVQLPTTKERGEPFGIGGLCKNL